VEIPEPLRKIVNCASHNDLVSTDENLRALAAETGELKWSLLAEELLKRRAGLLGPGITKVGRRRSP
jgi:hypothetical protein